MNQFNLLVNIYNNFNIKYKFMFKFKVLFHLLLVLIIIFYKNELFSEDVFQFSKVYIPANVEFEKSRTICLFPFRNSENNSQIEYLSKGLPAILASTFKTIKYAFDEKPLPMKIQYEYGINDQKISSTLIDKSIDNDPRYIKVEIKVLNELKPILREDSLQQGKSNSCFYIISGEYKLLSTDKLSIKIEITESKLGKFEEFNYSTTLKRAFQELRDLIPEIKNKYFLSGASTLTINTLPENEMFIYIDGELLGKSPLIKAPILPGKHKILIIKEGFIRLEQNLSVNSSGDSSFTFLLKKIVSIGKISIKTIPEGADVYYGNKYLGTSPIDSVDVPYGQNRLKISKIGYIDKYQGVEVSSDTIQNFSFKLKEGETDLYYKHNNNVFLDYSNFDLGNYSLYSTIVFYGLYMYSGYRESNEKDRLYGKAIFNSLTFYQGLALAANNSSTNGDVFLKSLAYQQQLVDQVEEGTSKYRMGQNIGIGGVFSMLILSGYFYYKGFNSDSFEIGLRPASGVNQSSEASIKYNIKF
jgi:hypothetical protein